MMTHHAILVIEEITFVNLDYSWLPAPHGVSWGLMGSHGVSWGLMGRRFGLLRHLSNQTAGSIGIFWRE